MSSSSAADPSSTGGGAHVAQHPLTDQLLPIFEELIANPVVTVPLSSSATAAGAAAAAAASATQLINSGATKSALLRLQNLVDEEADSLFHRSNAVNAQTKLLSQFIDGQLTKLLSQPQTRLSGIHVIEILRAVDYVEIGTRLKTFHDMLIKVVTDSSHSSKEAARVWGLLVDVAPGAATEMVDAQLVKCLVDLFGAESLGASKRFVGALMLQEVALRVAPQSVITKIDDLMRGIWMALRDTQDVTRAAASVALRRVLRIALQSAETSVGDSIMDNTLGQVVKSLMQKQREVGHGGLLALNAWFTASVGSQRSHGHHAIGELRIKEVYGLIVQLLQKPSTFAEIRLETVGCIPLMAQYDRTRFVDVCLAPFVIWAGTCYRNLTGPDERGPMFLAIGRLAGVLQDKVPLFVDRVMVFIEGSLVKQPKRDRCPEAGTCFAMIAAADPKTSRRFLRTVLHPLFQCTPTAEFAADIASICRSFPELRTFCMEKILEVTKAQFSNIKQRSALSAVSEDDTRILLNGLHVVSSLDTNGYSVLPFMTEMVLRFIQDPHEQVRRAVIAMCLKLAHSGCCAPGSPCRIDDHQGTMIHQGHQHIRLLLQVMLALINSAVADPESDIRLSTLESLTEAYDHVLSLQDCIRALFPALNDKHNNRIAVIRILGRLAKRNPACVDTMLRRVLLQSITEIQYFAQSKKQEQSTWVLAAVVEAAPGMVRPYIPALLKSTVDRLCDKGSPQAVQTALLACIGRLVRHSEGGDVDVMLLRTVRSIAVLHVMDSSCTPKKQEAIRALCEIVRATRDVAVYEQHPELLRVLLSALHGGFKETWPLRQDVLRLLGIMGAVDPVRVKNFYRMENDGKGSSNNSNGIGDANPNHHTAPVAGLRLRPEEAAAHSTVRAVMNVIELPSTHDTQCVEAMQALVNICTSRDMQLPSMISFFPKIIPAIIRHIHAHAKQREPLFRQLAILVGVAKHHIRGHLDDVVDVAKQYILCDDPEVLSQILLLLTELRRTLHEEFKPYLRVVLPLLAYAATEDVARSASKVFECFVAFGKLMDGHLHIVLPCIVEIATSVGAPVHTRVSAVSAIFSFSKHLMTISDHAARCVHCLCPILQARTQSPAEARDLVHAASTALLTLAQNLGPGFAKFGPIIKPIVAQRYGENSQDYAKFVHTIDEAVRSQTRYILPEMPPKAIDESRFTQPQTNRRREEPQHRFRAVRQHLLPIERTGEEEWKQWLRTLAIELLRASPCNAHGFALQLANIHEPFARELFHPAFAACFGEMDSNCRQEVIACLTTVLKSPKLPSEVLQELLNLSEYMERVDGGVGTSSSSIGASSSSSSSSRGRGGLFEISTVIDRSETCSLHAKALHYLEAQFVELTREYEQGLSHGRYNPLTDENWRQLLAVTEKSIYLCNLLGQRESANGALKYIQDHYSRLTNTAHKSSFSSQAPTTTSTTAADDVAGAQNNAGGFDILDAELLQKLQWWSQSLRAFQERLKTDPNNVANVRGVLQALDAQGEYSKLLEVYKAFARRASKKESAELATTGARAAWILQSWEDMEQFTSLVKSEGYQGTTAVFYNAVIAVHKREFRKAESLIGRCRRELDGALAALVAESYDRAYELLVGNQQLCELEEIIMALREPKSISHWKGLWERRLGNMAYEGWQGTLATHSLVLPHTEELDMWIQFVSLCRSNGRHRVSMEVLQKLLGDRKVADAFTHPTDIPRPIVALAAVTHMYESGKQANALTLLKSYVERYSTTEATTLDVLNDQADYARCRARLGEWTAAQNNAALCYNKALTDDVLHNLQLATVLDPSNGSTWHTWARVHHNIVIKGQSSLLDSQAMDHHVISALQGYLKSIESQQNLQDVLGFLSLWFVHGTRPAVMASGVFDEVMQINSNVWLRVLPQIIARLHTPNAILNEQVQDLLRNIGKTHPQALLYTLNVSSGVAVIGGDTSEDVLQRRKAAQRVLTRIAELHHNGQQLVQEAALVCRELVRCAVLWAEMWFDELDRAWWCWGREKDAAVVWGMIEPLMQLLANPESTMEHHFIQDFGVHIESAASLIRDAAMLPNHGVAQVEDAWGKFRTIVERLDKQIQSMSSLALQVVSPTLVRNGRNLLVAVPGQYREHGDFPRIASFHSTLKVMSSKQHPRRISIYGNDGVTYKFLLKGHEDLRLDERVMQLLGLVNTVLTANPSTNGKDCLVQTYSVTPLSDNAGLVGWVDHCDTIHQIIKDHRVHSKNISAELNAMKMFYEELPRLTVMQHVEPFEFALESTEGADIARSLWLRAPSAEHWLDRRTTYVRTLATMSMVGHILGLGDRHPSNLMIHSFSGRVVHIDFGDCFEVAQTRSTFPEKVPFRLTRMLVKAMEIGGIEGLFRHGCVGVMTVLREERNTLLSILEAFLHDPLVTWWRDDNDDAAADQPQTATTQQQPQRPQQQQGPAAAGFSLQRGHGEGLDVGSVSSLALPSLRRRTMASVRGPALNHNQQTKKAQKVMQRITEKLNGKEFISVDIQRSAFAAREALPVEEQVNRLILEATSHENLCQHFSGWCPFW
ncbi:phosphatidylinositol 3-kinase, putative [Bodo saltans]|uniref:Serine/threonine-protein kinase TOR n=1 Tax=Bodo saltans TaxID=75058 RepID=A0A0S4JRV6_BODSA|nr:phosphatidylinositol 3-kinase, putative [Bodo saltans]|eukprot:CUG94241.1 phosphatidylinositol 3-kinase, putative [Bodo saltans]